MYGIDSNSFQRFYSFFRQSCVTRHNNIDSFYLCYCGDSVRNVETNFNRKKNISEKRKFVYFIKAFKFIKILKFVHEV